MNVELLVTLWPSMPHFPQFVDDERIAAIRLNSAMMSGAELDSELQLTQSVSKPLFFDIKGRQPRIVEVLPNDHHLELRLNHPIEVDTPCGVIFKAGADFAVLDHLEEGGRRLVFQGGPRYTVKEGESLCIRHSSFRMLGPVFTEAEKEKVAKVKAAGFTRYFLSYVEDQSDVDEFVELVGKDSEVWLKIETMRGMSYVADAFKKRDNLTLVAARGDLYVEIDRPHRIAKALKLIIEKDPQACVASRLLLSIVEKVVDSETLWQYKDESGNLFYTSDSETNIRSPFTGEIVQSPPARTYLNAGKTFCNPVPSCADFLEMEWLRDIGYRRMMLCDELCLRRDLLGTAVQAFESFRRAG